MEASVYWLISDARGTPPSDPESLLLNLVRCLPGVTSLEGSYLLI